MNRQDPFYEQIVSSATEKEFQPRFNIEIDKCVQEKESIDMFGEDGVNLHSAEINSNLKQNCNQEKDEPALLPTERSFLGPFSKLE